MSEGISVDKEKLAKLCHNRHIIKLAFFGSVLRKDFNADSDLDVIVDFEENHIPGFLELYEIEQELSRLFAERRADLLTGKSLHPHLKQQVLDSAEVQYAAQGF